MSFSWPVSAEPPSAEDCQLHMPLRRYLIDNNLVDDAARAAYRQRAVDHVENICRRWAARHTGQEQGRIFLHGSLALGTQLRASDVDAIFIAPSSVSNAQFFSELPALLRSDSNTSNVQAITSAKWPIIKLRVFNEFDMDLQPVGCILNVVPEDIGERRVLCASDMLSLYSTDKYDALRAMRIKQFIIAALNETDIEMDEFRLAMQALKYWAKRNNIYGFDRFRKGAGLAGLSWCFLLVFVCQHYPQANCAVTLLRKLFELFGRDWPWPRPVCLRLVNELRTTSYGTAYAPSAPGMYSAMPTEKGLMPIMTPLPETSNRIDLIKYGHEKARIVSALQRGAAQMRAQSAAGGAANFWDKFFMQMPL